MTRRRDLPLGAWLAIGLALAVVLPTLGAATAWWVVAGRQRDDVRRRANAAVAIIARAAATGDGATLKRALGQPLARLDVEAELNALPDDAGASGPTAKADVPGVAALSPEELKATRAKQLSASGPVGSRAGPIGKPRTEPGYDTRTFDAGRVAGTLFVKRPGSAARIAAAAVVALLLLAAVLAAGFVLLRRWVVKPLGLLAGDADRIAGGRLDVSAVPSRTREVAQVGAALRGMADGLRGALAQRHATEQQRRFFVSAVAHDLRTPLFTLRGSLEAIEHGIGGPEQLRRAQDKATLLDRLVGDLFTFTHLEYAGPQLDVEELDAVALAHEAADTVDSRIAVTAPDRRVPLDGDPAALLRVLVNLLDNAVRHAHASVELVVRAEGDEVVFAVLDDGPGLAPEDLPHLFEPLFRADRARNSATGGAGLGLAIVQRLAEAHDATVTAETRSEGGASFTVRCPRRPPDQPRRSPTIAAAESTPKNAGAGSVERASS